MQTLDIAQRVLVAELLSQARPVRREELRELVEDELAFEAALIALTESRVITQLGNGFMLSSAAAQMAALLAV